MIDDFGNTAYLYGAKAVVTIPEPKSIFINPSNDPKPFSIKDKGKEYKGIAYWGKDNKLPSTLLNNIYSNPIISSAMEFKSLLTFGDGVIPVKRNKEGEFKPDFSNKVINSFLDDNDINGYILEASTDLQVFYNVFPEIICNNEAKPKVVELNHKEATFSRLETMNEKGVIEHHFYSALWGEEDTPTDMIATPMLNSRNPIKDLKYRLGIEKDPLNNIRQNKERRFIIPLNFPTPGRFYYRKPYWMSIIESGWYDFAQKIPEFKRALLNNGMIIKYHVEINPNFFDDLFRKYKANTEKEKLDAKKKWLDQLNDFLSKPSNAGKTFLSEFKMMGEKELSMVKITQMKNEFTGGEYLGDLEEVSNILSYGMGVHPSLIGSSPGKNKTINGTEARELFVIKQALMKPFRNRLLFPLYLIKAINNWPEDMHFTIPNLELTTLDKNTGAKKTISQPAIENTE